MANTSEIKIFQQEIKLTCGQTFTAKVAYKTFGTFTGDNAIMVPTAFTGSIATAWPWMYESGRVLDPAKYFIVICGVLGGGDSSSPSNTPPPFDRTRFPRTSYEDNSHLQYALCQKLGISKLFAYIGISMGGHQAYHMAILYPDFAERIIVVASCARTSYLTKSFLESMRLSLVNAVDYEGGEYTTKPVKALETFAKVKNTWFLGKDWYRRQQWKKEGFASLAAQQVSYNERIFTCDPNDLIALMDTWVPADISMFHGGDLAAALGAINAPALVIPVTQDAYFPIDEIVEEAKYLKRGKLVIRDSIQGHRACAGFTEEDRSFLEVEISKFFAETSEAL